ncbi:MAG TPA: peptidoglycan-binding domain-containing protein [Candidatus Omnitrophota bacterium]|nr:peptidoglycan-binding domain-containing protein [Candidatus Omnitrophota bacterium]HPD85476.1 peptidoglycan-binding domain-containing protein [Candidatus Omnitrophota bacterium]HRZ04023.1 peptidoglycan-binding domain-containing protein [Candidatus Omnitrophota bacterium]
MYRSLAVLIVLAIFVIGCGQKSQKESYLSTTEELLNESAATGTIQTLPSPAASETVVSPVDQAPVVETSFTAPTVNEIQQALKSANLYTGKIDGDLGPKTKKAIRDFQEQNGLTVDGKVGPKTWMKLKAFLNAAEQADSSTVQD